MKKKLYLLGLFMLLFLLAPKLILADGTISIEVSTEIKGADLDEVSISASVQSDYEIKEVRAVLKDRQVTLTKAKSHSPWTGKLSLQGLPKGTYTLTVTSADYGNQTGQKETTIKFLGRSTITVTEPSSFSVVRDGRVRVQAKAVDGLGKPLSLGLGYTINGRYNSGYMFEWFDAKEYEGKSIRFHFTSEDSNGHRESVDKDVFIERGLRLKETRSVDGKILDQDGNRILYKGQDGMLRIRNLTDGQEVTIPYKPTIDPAIDTIHEKLTPTGAIFEGFSHYFVRDPRYKVWKWDGSGLECLTPGNDEYAMWKIIDVKGDYGLYHSPQGVSIINFTSGSVKVIPASVNAGVLTSDGGVLFVAADEGLFRYNPDGTVTTLVQDGNYNGIAASGKYVLFNDYSTIYMYDGAQMSVIKEADGFNTEAGSGYQINGAWVAYIKKNASGSPQLFLRSPQGAEKQLTYFSSAPKLQYLHDDGSVAFSLGGKTYICPVNAEPIQVSSDLGTTAYDTRLGGWYKLLGNGIYQIYMGPQEADVTPPEWPAGSSLTVTDLTYRSAVLNWPQASDDKEVTAYLIYKQGRLDQVVKAPALQTKLEDLINLGGAKYNFDVIAEDAAGNRSQALYTVIIPPVYDYRPPTWDNGNTLTVTDVTYDSAKLSWPPAVDNIKVLRYAIYLDGKRIGEVQGDTTKYDVTGLTPGKTYQVIVIAEDEYNQSSNNPTATITTPTRPTDGDTSPPVWPNGNVLTVTDITYNSISLQWKPAQDNVGVASYEIYRDNLLSGTVAGSVYRYTAGGLAPGQTYVFSVIAKDAAGNVSLNNPVVSVTTTVYGGPHPSVGTLSLQAKPGALDVGSVLELNLKADSAQDLYAFLAKMEYVPERFRLGQVLLHGDFGVENQSAVLSKNTGTSGEVKLTGSLIGRVPGKTGNLHLITLKFVVQKAGKSDFTLLPGSSLSDSQGLTRTLSEPFTLTINAGSGDFDNDGRITLRDLVLISQANGLASGMPGFDARFDVNNDGKIDIADIQYVANKVAAAS
ncbi:fibronectin type III domain-containing protein [Paenibacillus elgii]